MIFLLYLFLLSLIVQVFYHLFVFGRLGLSRENAPSGYQPPVSIVICARNEADNLRRFLPSVLDQDYPVFEVVVVDDASSDETHEVLTGFAENHQQLKVVRIEEKTGDQPAGKKHALQTGIAHSRFDKILVTDADCQPATRSWLSGMAACAKDVDVVLGYSPYFPKSGLLNALIRYETALTGITYGSLAVLGHPYMGVGRNMLYEKKLFRGWSDKAKKLQSGDDDLFINALDKNVRFTVNFAPETHVFSEPQTTWSDWFRQKKRHLSAGKLYRTGDQFRLAIYSLSMLAFYLTVLILLILAPVKWIVPFALGLRFLSLAFVLTNSDKKLNIKDIAPFIFILDILFFIYYLVIGPLSLMNWGYNKWK